ncbi:UDP-2,4-diacetamido-2,4,6-trideoxy-beta-L-altropyranose hydrolase [Clostridium magnum]|uniref:UDP-2,4-diacetamido-2,4, 6-trideoxy-beta-L-altropyranose hydrolase n=1 Tax=Clostridium magnum DSM 2767 TaxID=1121326 RepID=A0A161YSR0_9CLOT|nr:UDP-2,4-diacetamido-2,4,6-trideoxy-beta-L-altropyranose hydrolase [Clostridium magnum]KZL94102.1 UDP-2,4-diacetamido-2,4,6-trideoxy-beta-L-altropyranose hydrolase [Clostridium magnum DSM 2767]SHH94992.1 UDP-2,4-diacetamido-2,4,6-trideoxy-beta-L-altropyranose hydrolase [Clostridium magnum DSM 2767]
MKIAIRADGGAKIGMGHIMRTLVLAKELRKHHNKVFYICRIDSEDIPSYDAELCHKFLSDKIKEIGISDKYKKGIEKITSEGFKVCFVREGHLLEDISTITADILITDNYNVDENYFNKTKTMFRKTTYIDDMNLYKFNVDFLLNQNVDAEDFNYKVNDDTKLILGAKYIMLRDEFRDLPPKNIKPKAGDIMLTVGGSDPFYLTDKILSWVRDLEFNFHVVVGPSFEHGEHLKKYENNKIKLYYNANMYKIMEKCDIAISACGSTLYELAACGVPTIGIIIADNQAGIGKKLNSMGIIKNLGWYDKIDKEDFLINVNKLINDYELRRTISQRASNIVDVKGAERIAKILTGNI